MKLLVLVEIEVPSHDNDIIEKGILLEGVLRNLIAMTPTSYKVSVTGEQVD